MDITVSTLHAGIHYQLPEKRRRCPDSLIQMSGFVELETTYEEIADHLNTLGLALYPGYLRSGKESDRLVWSGDDWRAFVNLAPQVGAPVLYVEQMILEEGGLPDEDDDPSGAARESLESHLGETYILVLAYVGHGVVHRMSLRTQWWNDAQDDSGAIVGVDANKEYERLISLAREGSWVLTIAYDPRFYGSKRRADWAVATTDILKELGVTVDPRAPWGPEFRISRWLCDLAGSMIDDVRAVITDRALDDIPNMATQLMTENPEWTSWRVGMREEKAKRLISEKYGWAIPVVVAEVARKKR